MTGERWTGDGWDLINADCVEECAKLPDDLIDLSVYSPPFVSLYTYSNTERDMGNCATADQFFQHFGFLIRELLRTTKPGRLTCAHIAQVPAMLERDGWIDRKSTRLNSSH